ncbi:GNAT family N-acetyltransferase [Afifella sp. IM 167]|uniref:GNAT family N-acetyltransferase n=1 Tax=Afifella sp. IM 167 TaxID=2033586 RepID=UPI001CCA0505|nr:N-acetyltransferase [Afifella sp. IM 167]MBZ8134853.1 GNAT family N-acetyltransferase [Afifella sp. IM 167]
MSDILIRPEAPEDEPTISALIAAAFGPGAYARAAFRVREQAPHAPELSFVALLDGAIAASVRLTPVTVGADAGFLLGPLVVDPPLKSRGYGKALVRHALLEARKIGIRFVILVGDAPYYGPLGFVPLPPGRVRMPGPCDPKRLLVAELEEGVGASLSGMVAGRLR